MVNEISSLFIILLLKKVKYINILFLFIEYMSDFLYSIDNILTKEECIQYMKLFDDPSKNNYHNKK